MKCAALIVAAGKGRRMGFDKLMAPLLGKSVLQWSLDAFLQAKSIDRIMIVTSPSRFEKLDLGTTKEVLRVDGGAERFLSVFNGLNAFDPPPRFVAIHDGARPFIMPEQIDEVFRVTRETGAAALAHPVSETLKKASHDGFTRSSLSRERLWVMETPQTFKFKMLHRAYETVLHRRMPITDDVSAAEAIGVATKLVENPLPNPKVTYMRDLPVAEALLKARG